MQEPVRVALIYGSTRENRFCDTVAHWAADRIWNDGGFRLDFVDPRDPGDFAKTADAADAFVVVTPEYNHSYPGPLKTLIDSLSREWWFKPVGFVSYGGISGGLRAVEHLRGVFAELNAVAIRDCVSFANAPDQFDAEGCPVDPEAASRAMARMLASLDWWARALRAARRAEQCSGVAA